MLISIHIPKAGGTSFAALLRAHFEQGFRVNYRETGVPPSLDLALRIPYGDRLLNTARCVHGHFRASRYRGPKITFIRHPLEIRISKYHYIRRRHAAEGLIADATWQLAVDNELRDFIALPLGDDMQQFIDIEPRKFAFIGCMDHYAEDVEIFCDRFLGKRYELPEINGNPAGRDYDLAEYLPNYRREAANRTELDLYDRMCEARLALM